MIRFVPEADSASGRAGSSGISMMNGVCVPAVPAVVRRMASK